MIIKIDDKDYSLDVQKAKSFGVLHEVRNYVVTLTENEIAALQVVLAHVGGNPATTARRHTASVVQKLNSLTFEGRDSTAPRCDMPLAVSKDTRGIYFLDQATLDAKIP